MRLLPLLGLCVALGPSGQALAQAPRGQPTPLLSADLRTGRRVRIDASSPQDLDAEFEKVLGAGSGFSTRQLERVLDRLRTDLLRERPRATPKLVVFLYPGRVDMDRLKALREIAVDIELVLDPCDRSVCQDAIGKHIEMVGRAIERPVLQTDSHRFLFQTLSLSSVTAAQAGDAELVRVPLADCVTAAARPQGGQAWLAARRHAEDDYVPLVTRAIAQKAVARRVALSAPPRVSRDGGTVHVLLRASGDRSRVEQQVVDALSAAVLGLRENPATPKQIELELELVVNLGRGVLRRFSAPGEAVGRYLDGGLSAPVLFSSYVAEKSRRKDVTTLDFAAEP